MLADDTLQNRRTQISFIDLLLLVALAAIGTAFWVRRPLSGLGVSCFCNLLCASLLSTIAIPEANLDLARLDRADLLWYVISYRNLCFYAPSAVHGSGGL